MPLTVGGRKHDAVARAISERSITLIKDARNSVPLPTPRTGSVLYLSVLDYPVGLAHRRAQPHRDPGAEGALAEHRIGGDFRSLDAVRARPGPRDGRQLRRDRRRRVRARVVGQRPARSRRRRWCGCCRICRAAASARAQPFVAMFFGNPYTPMFVPEIPSMMLTYDFSDYAEESAVKALAGEIAIGGKLPIALPGLFPLGHGLRAFDSITHSYGISLAVARCGGLRFGVDVLFPRQQLLMQPPHDGGVRRRQIVALAKVLA